MTNITGNAGVENSFFTINKQGFAEFVDRGSRFLAYACPVNSPEDFKACLQAIKKEHPKASHYCFAYRIGTAGNQFRISDAGEPSGSAGRPILGQIDSRKVTNVAVIVVRFFGGTLLGIPGLINAYKTASSLALQVTPIVEKQVEIPYCIEFDYTLMQSVMQVLKYFNCRIISSDTQLFCLIKTGIPRNRMEEVVYKLSELPGLTMTQI